MNAYLVNLIKLNSGYFAKGYKIFFGRSKILAGVILVALSVSLFLWLGEIGVFRRAEQWSMFLRFKTRKALPEKVNIFYFVADNEAINQFGPQPWTRGRFGDIANIIHEHCDPKSIFFDWVFSADGHPYAREGNDSLRSALSRRSDAVVGAAYTYGKGILQEWNALPLKIDGYNDRDKNDIPVLPELLAVGTRARAGLLDVLEPLLQVPLFVETPRGNFYAAGLEVVCIALGADVDKMKISEDELCICDSQGKILRHVPIEDGQLLNVNWPRTWNASNSASILDLAIAALYSKSDDESQRKEAAEFFSRLNNALIFIGPSDTLSKDLSETPIDTYAPRVGVHGAVAETILTENYLRSVPKYLCWVCVGSFGLLSFFLFNRRVGSKMRVFIRFSVPLLLLLYIGLAEVLFLKGWIIEVVPEVCSLGFSILLSLISVLVGRDKTEARIKASFSSYVSPLLVTKMVEDEEPPAIGGALYDIASMFTDVEAFSTIAQSMSATDLVACMNSYFDVATTQIFKNDGTLDKYIGDAVVAFFGAPLTDANAALKAIKSAAAIIDNEIQQKNDKKEEGRGTLFRTRIGINYGQALVGNIGSRYRFNYTMMGDSVNLAARCESACKQYGVYCIITDPVVVSAPDANKLFIIRRLDRVTVVGRNEPVIIYELMGSRITLKDELDALIQLYEVGLNNYLAGDWAAAATCFEDALALEREKGKNPSAVMLERLKKFGFIAPSGWSGISSLTEK